jgi:hypothetical protein
MLRNLQCSSLHVSTGIEVSQSFLHKAQQNNLNIWWRQVDDASTERRAMSQSTNWNLFLAVRIDCIREWLVAMWWAWPLGPYFLVPLCLILNTIFLEDKYYWTATWAGAPASGGPRAVAPLPPLMGRPCRVRRLPSAKFIKFLRSNWNFLLEER